MKVVTGRVVGGKISPRRIAVRADASEFVDGQKLLAELKGQKHG